MEKFIKKLWDKVITSNITPALIGLLAVFSGVAWLLALFVAAITLILNMIGVI